MDQEVFDKLNDILYGYSKGKTIYARCKRDNSIFTARVRLRILENNVGLCIDCPTCGRVYVWKDNRWYSDRELFVREDNKWVK